VYSSAINVQNIAFQIPPSLLSISHSIMDW
jgi:hypothetical protein